MRPMYRGALSSSHRRMTPVGENGKDGNLTNGPSTGLTRFMVVYVISRFVAGIACDLSAYRLQIKHPSLAHHDIRPNMGQGPIGDLETKITRKEKIIHPASGPKREKVGWYIL